MRALVVIVVCAWFMACSRHESPAPANSAQPVALAVPPSTSPPQPTVVPTAIAIEKTETDVVSKALRTAPITAVEISSWSKPGVMHASLQVPQKEGPARVMLSLALDQNPIAHRRPYAYALLARELGMRVVPATVVRRVTTGELGELFANEPDARAYMAAHSSVQNDGTIAALVIAPSRGPAPRAWEQVAWRDIVLDEAPEARAWARWAASPEPVPGENAALLRDYVETVVLDYLTANIMRRSVLLDDAGAEMMVADNEGAFPIKLEPRADERLLERLRTIVRFPRTMRDALNRLTRTRARELLTPEPFDNWLVAPRSLIGMDERRVSVLTLIEARVIDLGDNAVLCL